MEFQTNGHKNGYLRVTVYGGSAGGRVEEAFNKFNDEWVANGRDWQTLNPTRVGDLDTMWLAAHLGKILVQHDLGLINGGTNEGIMGAINIAYAEAAQNHNKQLKALGVPIAGYFPKLFNHPGIDIVPVQTLTERFTQFHQGDAFVILRGKHGTHAETTAIIEEEQLKDFAKQRNNGNGHLNLSPRPIIVADQTPRTLDRLAVIYGDPGYGFLDDHQENVLDRIYVLPPQAFRYTRETPLNSTLEFSQMGQDALVSIILRNHTAMQELRTLGCFTSLREALLKRNRSE